MSSYHDKNDVNEIKDPFPTVARVISSEDFKREIGSSRRILRSISSSNRSRNCQRFARGLNAEQTVVINPAGKVVEARFSKLAICSRASCPNCGHIRGAKAEKQINAIVKTTHENGGLAQLLVATSRSAARLDHEILISVQNKAYAKFLAKMNTREREKYGIAGMVHMPEISYTEAGINPHSNIIVIYSEKATEVTQRLVERVFSRIWIETHASHDLPKPTRKNGVVSQEIYNAETVSGYLTKSYKHGVPRSLFNNRWLKENGELDDAGKGTVGNPHDILRIINADPKMARYFIRLAKDEEIIRLGGLEFGVSNKSTGEIKELKRLPKIVRHWLDYETVTKGRNIISITKASEKAESIQDVFWQAVCASLENLDEPKVEREGYQTINISYDASKWAEARYGIDTVIMDLNLAVLKMTVNSNAEDSIKNSLMPLIETWDLEFAKGEISSEEKELPVATESTRKIAA